MLFSVQQFAIKLHMHKSISTRIDFRILATATLLVFCVISCAILFTGSEINSFNHDPRNHLVIIYTQS